MNKIITLGLIPLFALTLTSCSSLSRGEKGALIGGGTGALIGGVAGGGTGAAIGAVGGAVVGGVIGHATRDRRKCKVYYRNGKCKVYFKN